MERHGTAALPSSVHGKSALDRTCIRSLFSPTAAKSAGKSRTSEREAGFVATICNISNVSSHNFPKAILAREWISRVQVALSLVAPSLVVHGILTPLSDGCACTWSLWFSRVLDVMLAGCGNR